MGNKRIRGIRLCLVALSVFALTTTGKAQVWQEIHTLYDYDHVAGKKSLLLPTGCGTPTGLGTLINNKLRRAALYFDTCADKMYRFNPTDTTWAEVGGGGAGSPNSNVGAGYRIAVPGTNNIKTLFAGPGVYLDSTSNTNGITVLTETKLDTSRSASTASIISSTGNAAVIKLVDLGSNRAGLMSPADKLRLDSLYLGLLEDSIVIAHAGDSGKRIFFVRNDSLFLKRINVVGGTITTNADSSITITISTPGGTVTGTGTTNQVAYWTGGSAVGGDAGMTYNATTNQLNTDVLVGNNAIGIGMTPGVLLDINNYNASAERRTITNGTSGQMVWVGAGVATSFLGNAGNSGTYQGLYMGTNNNFPVNFFTANVERLRITDLGKIGIGLTPSYKLDILENDVGTITALRALNVRLLTTISTVAAARTAYAVRGVNSASISSGSNALTNIGLYGSAKNGTFNYSIHADTGTAQIGPIGVTDVSKRLYVNGSVGINPDSIATVTPSTQSMLILATDGTVQKATGVGFTNPMTTAGDIIGSTTSGAPVRIAKGTANQILGMNSGATAQEYKTLTEGTGISIVHSAGAVTLSATGLPTYGSWTPTATSVTNVDGFTINQGRYTKNGDVVTCSITISVDPTTAGLTEVGLSPVSPSTFSGSAVVSGTGTSDEGYCGRVSADAANSRLKFAFTAVNGVEVIFSLTIQYTQTSP